jgi:translation initiation factor 2B subunit (eIF-2B alpha/beta/delta family)
MVNHYPDMGLRYALKNTDVVLLGCDSIDLKGVYNKIGSEIIAESANCFNVPLYICTSSLKFNFDCLAGEYTAIEERDAKEVWDFEHARLTVKNYAFERIHPSYITGVISDLGVHSFEDFLVHVIKKYNASEQSAKKK